MGGVAGWFEGGAVPVRTSLYGRTFSLKTWSCEIYVRALVCTRNLMRLTDGHYLICVQHAVHAMGARRFAILFMRVGWMASA